MEMARKSQDDVFYTESFPKFHATSLISHLCDLAYEEEWIWPHKVEAGYVKAQRDLAFQVGTTHDIEAIKDVVAMFKQRHEVFTNLKSRDGFKWDHQEERFKAKPHHWMEAVQEDERALWYYYVGEEKWREVIIVFQGWDELYEATRQSPTAIVIPSSLSLEEFQLQMPSPTNTPLQPSPTINLTPKPEPVPMWKLDNGTPYPPMSPAFVDSFVKCVAEHSCSENSKTAKKKLFDNE